MRFIAALGFLGFLAGAFVVLGFVSTLSVNKFLEDSLLSWLDQPASTSEERPRPVEFEVQSGESADEIARRLEQAGLIRNAMSFSLISRLRAADTALEAGVFYLSPDMPVSVILAELGQGRSRTIRVTLREGLRIAEVADELAANSITDRDSFVYLATGNAKWVEDVTGRPPGSGLEGYLFPDTYDFELDQPAEAIIEQLIQNFLIRFDEDLQEQASEIGRSVHEVVTLASIVEKEAVLPAERPIIAAVFLNRLEQSIPLGADPTTQYALVGDDILRDNYWKIELTADDLNNPSPYNTRLSSNTGLPPGPICSPGLDSILAVLMPADTDALYFVARPDGSHAFARTLEEHNMNVRRYQR